MYFHWQNLNERPEGDGHPFRHGRGWLVLGDGLPTIGFCWSHGELHLALTLDVDRDDREVVLRIAIPGAQYFLSAEGLPRALFEALRPAFKWHRNRYEYQGGNRSIGLRVFDWALWWSLWEDSHESSSKDPWWWRGRIGVDDVLDSLFGREKYEDKVIDERDVVIPMPERGYPAKVKVEVRTFTRPRFPWWPLSRRRVGSDVQIVKGDVPFPGKGENSWDCGPDGMSRMSSGATSVESAIGEFVATVLRYRRQRGGTYEPPVEVAR